MEFIPSQVLSCATNKKTLQGRLFSTDIKKKWIAKGIRKIQAPRVTLSFWVHRETMKLKNVEGQSLLSVLLEIKGYINGDNATLKWATV